MTVRKEEGRDASLGSCQVWELVQCSLPFCARCEDSKLIAGHFGRWMAAERRWSRREVPGERCEEESDRGG